MPDQMVAMAAAVFLYSGTRYRYTGGGGSKEFLVIVF